MNRKLTDKERTWMEKVIKEKHIEIPYDLNTLTVVGKCGCSESTCESVYFTKDKNLMKLSTSPGDLFIDDRYVIIHWVKDTKQITELEVI